MHVRVHVCLCDLCVARAMPKRFCLMAEWGAARGYICYRRRRTRGSAWRRIPLERWLGGSLGTCVSVCVLV